MAEGNLTSPHDSHYKSLNSIKIVTVTASTLLKSYLSWISTSGTAPFLHGELVLGGRLSAQQPLLFRVCRLHPASVTWRDVTKARRAYCHMTSHVLRARTTLKTAPVWQSSASASPLQAACPYIRGHKIKIEITPKLWRHSVFHQKAALLVYLSTPSLRILYFSRNSLCFRRRISVCFLKPLTLRRRTEEQIELHNETRFFQQCARMKMKLWLQPPGSLFGFVVNFCDNAILLIHEVVVNFFQLPERT